MTMTETDLRTLKAWILANGTIEDAEMEVLRWEFNAGDTIDQEGAEFLIELRNEARSVCPAFEELLFRAIKDNVLIDGAVDAEKATWLRQMLFANDRRIDKRERQFLWEVIIGARWTSHEFKALYLECMK